MLLNSRNIQDVRICTTEPYGRMLVAQPNFNSFYILSENVTLVHMNKCCIKYSNPIHIGACILELSKYHMLNFHYNVMLKMYGPERCQLLATDTDSFIYQIFTNNLFADMKLHLDWFDTANYDKSNPAYSVKNKAVLGKFKDELPNVIAKEFVGLSPKMYSLENEDGTVKRACKGVSKSYMQKHIRHEHYKAILFSTDGAMLEQTENVSVVCNNVDEVQTQQTEVGEALRLCKEAKTATFKRIGSVQQQLQTITVTKRCLNKMDIKRYIEKHDSHKTLPFGHYIL